MTFTTNRKFGERIQQLVLDGYLAPKRDTGELHLTEKGLAVLLAEADRPQFLQRLVKPTLARERRKASHAGRVKPRDNLEGKDREDA